MRVVRTVRDMLLLVAISAVASPAVAQQTPPPPVPANALPERDPLPGPYLVFFDDAGMMPAYEEVLRLAVERWQLDGNEAFLLCSRAKEGAGGGKAPDKSVVARRLRAHGAKVVVSDSTASCQGPLVNDAQRTFGSVEVRGGYAF